MRFYPGLMRTGLISVIAALALAEAGVALRDVECVRIAAPTGVDPGLTHEILKSIYN